MGTIMAARDITGIHKLGNVVPPMRRNTGCFESIKRVVIISLRLLFQSVRKIP
jgi:hypothetical protein